MAILDEKALRTPAFSEGPAVVLADGQPWHFPIPGAPGLPEQPEAITLEQLRAWKAADPGAGKAIPARAARDGGAEVRGMLDTLNCGAMIRAAGLLRCNYRVPELTLFALVEARLDSEASIRMWEQIAPVLGDHCRRTEPSHAA